MFRYSLHSLLLGVTACAMALGVWLNRDMIPGTLYHDGNGFPHGTGMETYTYDTGQLMLKEWYRRGVIYQATWYRPDGTEIATEKYDKKTGGVGYYLRQDGTISCKYTCSYRPSDRLYVADGDATFYRVDGTVEKVVKFANGVEATPGRVEMQ